jgi:hypothetical protein
MRKAVKDEANREARKAAIGYPLWLACSGFYTFIREMMTLRRKDGFETKFLRQRRADLIES